jgi:flagellar motor protein MotB
MPRTVTKKRRKVSKGVQGGVDMDTGEWVPVGILQTYNRNPRKGDVEKVAESLKEHGQIKSIGVNRGSKTGRKNEVLFGNHTFMAAKKLGWDKIWVKWYDVSETKAKQIMVADNGATDGATYDDQILAEILSEIKEETGTLVGTTYTDDILGKMVAQTTNKNENSDINNVEDAPDQLEGVDDLTNFRFFPSDAPYEIPELKLAGLVQEVPQPLRVWAGHELDGADIIGQEEWEGMWWMSMWHAGSRGINWKRAIPYFYTDDFHFEPVYNDPATNTKKILNLGIQMAVMPNYTIYPEMPTALWVYAAYRSFFVARYFQEAGIAVIPDIQTGMDDAVLDISLAGIPEGAPVVSTQAQMSKGDKNAIRKKARLLKEAEDRLQFQHIMVYGHTDADQVIEYANFDCEVTKVVARTARRREYLNSGSTINSQKVKKGKRKVKR